MKVFDQCPAAVLNLALFWLPLQPALAQTPVPPPPPIEEKAPLASDQYALGLDSLTQPGVPAGKTFQFEMRNSKIFPGTVRTITVYIPAAYKGDKPACIYVGLDGLGLYALIVFDNLIWHAGRPRTVL